MYVPVNQMPLHSRVWVYQAERVLTAEEQNHISKTLSAFAHSWMSHGKELKASFELLLDRFVCIMVDEQHNNTGGCSIDASVKKIQELGNQLKINLLDRRVIFKNEDQIQSASLSTFKIMAETGELGTNTVLFNTLCYSLEELRNKFEVPVLKSWASKYFSVAV